MSSCAMRKSLSSSTACRRAHEYSDTACAPKYQGRFHALPTNGYAMYAPEVRAISDEERLGVRD
jgi:hypothetical protein